LDDVPEDFRKDAEAFAQGLEKSIHGGNASGVQAAFDTEHTMELICDGISGPPESLSQIKSGIHQAMRISMPQITDLWIRQDVKYKGLLIYKGELAARFRFIAEDRGISMTDLVLNTNRSGRIIVANFYDHNTDYELIEGSKVSSLSLLLDIDNSFIARFLNQPNIDDGQLRQFAGMTSALAEKNYVKAVNHYRTLSDPLRNSIIASRLYVMALHLSRNTNGYIQALKDVSTRFDHPSWQLALMKAYHAEKNYDKAIACLDSFMESTGKDAALLTWKSLLLNEKGDVFLARRKLQEALKLELDCAYAHLNGLDVFLAAQDFAAVRDSIQFLEKNAGYSFKGKLTDPIWREFKKAPESKPWR
jgi:tetratricopeptide (TPR) repeat protein